MRHHPDRERSAMVKAEVVPACSNLTGGDQFFYHRAGQRRADEAFHPRGGLAVLGVLDHLRDPRQRLQRLQRRVAVGFGAGGIGLGLFGFLAGRHALMRQQILVQIGQLAQGLGGDQRLAIGADRGGRNRARSPPPARRPFFTYVARFHDQARHRPAERRQHCGRLIVVEIHRAAGIHFAAILARVARCRAGCCAAVPASV